MYSHQAETGAHNIEQNIFLKEMIASRAVLCLPGLGYDCFRIWETLLAG